MALVVSGCMAVMRALGAHWNKVAAQPYRPFTRWLPLELAVDWLVMLIGCAAALVVLQWCRRPRSGVRPTVRFWLVAVGVQLICWLPYELVYWPGIVGRDSWSSIIMGIGREQMSNHHPVLFSLWVGFCVRLARVFGGDTTIGVAIFSISQAIFLAAGLAVCALWVRARIGRWAGWASLAFFALDPAIALWSITMHKDTMFVLWVTLLAVLLAEIARGGLGLLRKPRWLLALAGLLVAVSFTRNNGPYIAAGVVAVIALLALPALLTPKRSGKAWWRIPAVGLAVLVGVAAIQGPGYTAAGVIPSERVESVGLQLHQVGWAVRYGHVDAQQAAVLTNIMPLDQWRAVYSPPIVDSVKFAKGFNGAWLNSHPDEFTAVWLDLMATNQTGYVKAWYALSGGYLDPDHLFFRMDPGTKRGSRGIVVNDHDLIGPKLGISNLAAQKVPRAATVVATAPGLDLASSTPLIFWGCVLACAAALVRRRPVSVLPMLPFIGLVGTLLIASPLTDYRYIAAGHVGLPVLLAIGWSGPQPRARLPWPSRRP